MTALLAGALAGLLVFAAHLTLTSPLIIQAEVFESGGGHSHSASETAAAGHHDEAEAAEAASEDVFERHAYTLLADLLTSIGFAFVLAGAIALSGREVDPDEGLIWGLCGFAVFHASVGLGLPPELPGMQAADLTERQIWWSATAAATAAGLALFFFAGGPWLKILAVVLLIAPHIVGAPTEEFLAGAVPAELAAKFTAVSLIVAGLFWLALGGLTGYFYRRFGQPA